MSDGLPPQSAPPESVPAESVQPKTVWPDPPAEAAVREAVARAEAVATRRRWINLGEFVAVAGLVIGGTSLWLNWSDRRADLAEQQVEKTADARQAGRYAIAGAVERSGDIRIVPDARHALGDVTVAFPAALGVVPQTSPTQTIAKRWYEAALLKATDGGADNRTGTLPVLVTVQYFNDDTPMSATGTYDIVWQTRGRPLLGRALHIIGFNRRASGGTQAQIEQLWAAQTVAR